MGCYLIKILDNSLFSFYYKEILSCLYIPLRRYNVKKYLVFIYMLNTSAHEVSFFVPGNGRDSNFYYIVLAFENICKYKYSHRIQICRTCTCIRQSVCKLLLKIIKMLTNYGKKCVDQYKKSLFKRLSAKFYNFINNYRKP